jgi:hypothetical protein
MDDRPHPPRHLLVSRQLAHLARQRPLLLLGSCDPLLKAGDALSVLGLRPRGRLIEVLAEQLSPARSEHVLGEELIDGPVQQFFAHPQRLGMVRVALGRARVLVIDRAHVVGVAALGLADQPPAADGAADERPEQVGSLRLRVGVGPVALPRALRDSPDRRRLLPQLPRDERRVRPLRRPDPLRLALPPGLALALVPDHVARVLRVGEDVLDRRWRPVPGPVAPVVVGRRRVGIRVRIQPVRDGHVAQPQLGPPLEDHRHHARPVRVLHQDRFVHPQRPLRRHRVRLALGQVSVRHRPRVPALLRVRLHARPGLDQEIEPVPLSDPLLDPPEQHRARIRPVELQRLIGGQQRHPELPQLPLKPLAVHRLTSRPFDGRAHDRLEGPIPAGRIPPKVRQPARARHRHIEQLVVTAVAPVVQRERTGLDIPVVRGDVEAVRQLRLHLAQLPWDRQRRVLKLGRGDSAHERDRHHADATPRAHAPVSREAKPSRRCRKCHRNTPMIAAAWRTSRSCARSPSTTTIRYLTRNFPLGF